MNVEYIKEHELPFKELETIGLAAGDQLLLKVDDLKNLLSGRRTGLLQLQNLEAENIRIKSMDAKISLAHAAGGRTELRIHPVYRKPQMSDFLNAREAEQLISGETGYLKRITRDDKGAEKELLIEFDAETREFIISDTDKILAPDMVNGEFLTATQKENYRKGKEVQLADKTTFQYSAADLNGIRADKIALVASILIDGGLTYVLYKGLNALFNRKRDEKEAATLSPGYQNALNDMHEQQPGNVRTQEKRSYTRNGTSR